MRIKDIAQVRVSYGYRRIHVMLLREGWKVKLISGVINTIKNLKDGAFLY
jgi:hypothetical protein